ncbi:MAG: hypothetical protein VKL39_07560 [Leptolyngbyaceae bacterium]|nr:hypothetical protein [Leptolyngbyaceae bacterium]
MSLKAQVGKVVDLTIIAGYSAFAFAIMPALVLSAWLIEHVSADLTDSDV